MRKRKSSRIELREAMHTVAEALPLFALLNLGLVQSLASGALTPEEVSETFYHGGNCQFVRRAIHSKTADAIMSRGAQLADLFTVLPEAEARREFYAELEAIRSLCLKLLARPRASAPGARVAA